MRGWWFMLVTTAWGLPVDHASPSSVDWITPTSKWSGLPAFSLT